MYGTCPNDARVQNNVLYSEAAVMSGLYASSGRHPAAMASQTAGLL